MPQPTPRFLYVRLPADLLDALEATRFHSSRRVGKRVSLRALVHLALEDFVAEIESSEPAQQHLDERLGADGDDVSENESVAGNA